MPSGAHLQAQTHLVIPILCFTHTVPVPLHQYVLSYTFKLCLPSALCTLPYFCPHNSLTTLSTQACHPYLPTVTITTSSTYTCPLNLYMHFIQTQNIQSLSYSSLHSFLSSSNPFTLKHTALIGAFI